MKDVVNGEGKTERPLRLKVLERRNRIRHFFVVKAFVVGGENKTKHVRRFEVSRVVPLYRL